jgi:hypothetical protein
MRSVRFWTLEDSVLYSQGMTVILKAPVARKEQVLLRQCSVSSSNYGTFFNKEAKVELISVATWFECV